MGNPVVHFEVVGKDGKKLQQFYGSLFDWKIENMPEMNYGMVEAKGSDGHGIGGGIGETPQGDSHVIFYVEVDDPQVALDKAVSLGGKVVMPVTDMGMVIFAQFADPEGHVVGLVKAGS
jgi:predicted enzyme related to lactoylglutathione lyase